MSPLDAGAGLVGTGGTRAALDTGRQGEDTGVVVMLGSPRVAAAAAASIPAPPSTPMLGIYTLPMVPTVGDIPRTQP